MTDYTKLPNPFTQAERNHLNNCLELGIASMKRSQKQRPQFEMIAKQMEDELQQLFQKINAWK